MKEVEQGRREKVVSLVILDIISTNDKTVLNNNEKEKKELE